jgi:hypothetical protein
MNDQVKNLVQIRKSLARGKAGKLAQNQAFIDFLRMQKQLESEFEATWSVIRAHGTIRHPQHQRRLGSRTMFPTLLTFRQGLPRALPNKVLMASKVKALYEKPQRPSFLVALK